MVPRDTKLILCNLARHISKAFFSIDINWNANNPFKPLKCYPLLFFFIINVDRLNKTTCPRFLYFVHISKQNILLKLMACTSNILYVRALVCPGTTVSGKLKVLFFGHEWCVKLTDLVSFLCNSLVIGCLLYTHVQLVKSSFCQTMCNVFFSLCGAHHTMCYVGPIIQCVMSFVWVKSKLILYKQVCFKLTATLLILAPKVISYFYSLVINELFYFH